MINIIRAPRISLLARPEFIYPSHIDWESDSGNSAEVLPEFAGRLCYLSFGKGELDGHRTIDGRTNNEEYLEHILDVRHGAVVEHTVFSLLFEGVSRSLTHELVRHRHFSYSQLSQRYVDESAVAFVLPPEIREGSVAFHIWFDSNLQATRNYQDLLAEMEDLLREEPDSTLRRKRARQTARSVLPNCTETKIVVTGNVRAWRNFLEQRASLAADTEICRLAVAVHNVLLHQAPALFSDYVLQEKDGREYLTTDKVKV